MVFFTDRLIVMKTDWRYGHMSHENNIQYDNCVHIFEANDLTQTMVQSNNEYVLKEIKEDLSKQYGQEVCDSISPYLIKVNHKFDRELLKKIEQKVANIIDKQNSQGLEIYKFHKKTIDSTFVDMDYYVTIMIW